MYVSQFQKARSLFNLIEIDIFDPKSTQLLKLPSLSGYKNKLPFF